MNAIANHPDREIEVPVDGVELQGNLLVPDSAKGIVVFAHGSGSSRLSSRNQFVAREMRGAAFGTLLFDLLTEAEETEDDRTARLRFDIAFLAKRLVATTRWLARQPAARSLPIGYFGASTGGAAALVAAAELGSAISAVVLRGGRPDLAGESLPLVTSPTLLIVGERDELVWRLNRQAQAQLRCPSQLSVIKHATHLFPEPGALEEVARLAKAWYQQHLEAGGRNLT